MFSLAWRVACSVWKLKDCGSWKKGVDLDVGSSGQSRTTDVTVGLSLYWPRLMDAFLIHLRQRCQRSSFAFKVCDWVPYWNVRDVAILDVAKAVRTRLGLARLGIGMLVRRRWRPTGYPASSKQSLRKIHSPASCQCAAKCMPDMIYIFKKIGCALLSANL